MGTIDIFPDMLDPMQTEYSQIVTRFDPAYGASWVLMNPKSVPCFTPELLTELQCYNRSIEYSGGKIWSGGKFHSIRYMVYASLTPGIFNLGGQLALFKDLIRAGGREELAHYAKMCIDAMASRVRHYDLPVVTISLVQGDAMGGGFEAALTSDIIIAERSSQMGFPEIMFNLFPGMGAYSFVARKIGHVQAEKIILSGKLYSAEELYEMGLVDVLVEDGEGENAVYEYIRKQDRRANGYIALQKVRHRFNPVTYQELMDITSIWVDAALQLGERDLKVMDRFVRSQQRLFGNNEPVQHHVAEPREREVALAL